MPRRLLVLTLAGVVLLLPALCTGGWLLHPCDCGTGASCEHEIDCEDDPCETGVLRTESAVSQVEATMAQQPVANPAADLVDEALRAARGPITSPHPAPATAAWRNDGRPYPPSDLPLLI